MHKQTKAFLDKTIAEPKKKLTDAYLETKETKITKRDVVGQSASRLYNKPSSQLYLQKHRNLAKKTKLELLQYATKNMDKLGYASLGNTISEQILDRIDGKPIQTQQTTNTNINLNIEGSKELADNFTEFLKQNTAS